VECALDLLKKRFNILVTPDKSYSQRALKLIMRVCITLHNMIIDDERDDDYDENYYIVTFVIVPPFTYETPANFTIILQMDGCVFDF
jgi:hypothetical protein